jgi:hypothetical protein
VAIKVYKSALLLELPFGKSEVLTAFGLEVGEGEMEGA